ncbi:oligoribonuclease-like [Leptopilina boulardi]|uniref:oligoribonuclease-like n=1 Tax=Leptopilina boulardi TaxID=63433 RepID=UPI0021F5AE93|nr:oligoribonuclease-like [Leptopilina boulardi]
MIILRRSFSHLMKYLRYKTSNISRNVCNSGEMSSITFRKSDYIVWMDMEMTGLNPQENKILEIACLVTDGNLKTVSNEFQVVIHQSDEELTGMDEWNTKHHRKSGLIDASRKSTITNNDAELMMLQFLEKYCPYKTCPLAGNSIYMDRTFLMAQMPLVHEYLHYRIIDVSSINEIVRRWNRNIYDERPQKCFNHRALSDIQESIDELDYYRRYMFKPNCNES